MKTYSQFVSEAVDGGLYSFRKPTDTTREILVEWMKENRIPNPIPEDELHVSIVCSETSVPNYNPDLVPVWVNPATYRTDILGDALVLHFKSDILTRQWQTANIMGAKSRWPSFQPHLSLSYNVPVEFDLSNIKPLPVQMILDKEECRGMVDGWASVKGLREYTVGDMTLGGGPVIRSGMNVPGSRVPQVNNTDIPEFITWLERQGIEVNFIKADVLTLKPAQSVDDIPPSIPDNSLTQPLITSNDNYILDGHARWQVLLNKDPHFKADTYQVDLPIKSLLAIAHGFPKTTYRQPVQ